MAERNFTFKDIDNLQQLRDELAVQAHLFKAEAADSWKELDQRWQDLTAQMEPLRKAARESGEEIGEAGSLLAETLKQGFDNIRKALKQ